MVHLAMGRVQVLPHPYAAASAAGKSSPVLAAASAPAIKSTSFSEGYSVTRLALECELAKMC